MRTYSQEGIYEEDIPKSFEKKIMVINPSIIQKIVNDKLYDPLYTTSEGLPIAAVDILYGWRLPIAKGNEYMAHKCGFTYSLLTKAFAEAGFKSRCGGRSENKWELFLVAFKQQKSEEEAITIANHLV